jgi:hypothetical protein
MRITLLALSWFIVSVAGAWPHEAAEPHQHEPQAPQSSSDPTPYRWVVVIVTTTNSDTMGFRTFEEMLRVLGPRIDDKTLFLKVHRNNHMLERWSKPGID